MYLWIYGSFYLWSTSSASAWRCCYWQTGQCLPPRHEWGAQLALLPNMEKQIGTFLLISSQLDKSFWVEPEKVAMKKFGLEYLGLQSPSTKSVDFYALSEAFHSLQDNVLQLCLLQYMKEEFLFKSMHVPGSMLWETTASGCTLPTLLQFLSVHADVFKLVAISKLLQRL